MTNNTIMTAIFTASQSSGMDRFDLEAANEGRSIRAFKSEYAMARPCSKRDSRMLRGALGAAGRKGLMTVPR